MKHGCSSGARRAGCSVWPICMGKGAVMLAVNVFVPSEANGNDIDSKEREEALNHVLQRMSALFGGATVYEAQGAWSKGQGIVREHVTVAKSYTDEETASANWSSVQDLGKWLKSQLHQDSVLISSEPVQTVEFI